METAVTEKPERVTLPEFRCSGRFKGKKCGKLLGYISGKASIKCPRCGTINEK